MSELIDVACDICVKQYRWPDERLGETATCRYCGTKFEVKRYVPPEDDTNANDLQWFKGVGIAILVASVAVGLGSLLFIRPGQTGWNTAGRSMPSPPTTSWPSTSRPDFAQHRPFHINTPARETLPLDQLASPRAPAAETPLIVPATAPPNEASTVPGPPVVTGWEFVGQQRARPKLRITGRGFTGLTAMQHNFGPGLADSQFELISDSQVDTDGFWIRRGETTVYTLANPKGVAVVFSDDIVTVTGRQTLDGVAEVGKFYLIQNGGHFTSNRPVAVLVESGGIAEMKPWASIGIVKSGGSIKSSIALNLLLEPGASVYPAPKNLDELTRPSITFYRLAPVAK